MGEPIKISISKNHLEELLKADPKVFVQLETMACEKIAEEITRKVSTGAGSISKALKGEFEKSMAELTRQAAYGHVTNSVQNAINTAVDKAIASGVRAAQNKVYEEVQARVIELVTAGQRRIEREIADRIEKATKLLNEATQQAADEFMRAIPDRIEKQARASFIDVIREAKGVTG